MKRNIPALVLIILLIIAYGSGGLAMINLEMIQAQKNMILTYKNAHFILTALVFWLVYAGSVALSLPLATLLTLLGGFLFGQFLGTILVVTAATIGATILFLIARTTLGKTLHEKAGSLYERVADNMNDNATGYLLFLRLVPLFPFVLVNILPALFHIRLRVFVLTTLIGIIPGSFVYVNVGKTLGELESLSDVTAPQTLWAFGLLGVFALIPTLYKNMKKKENTHEHN